MIPRHIADEFRVLLSEYPVVTIVGPRQSGKTTLARTLLPDWNYVSLENPDLREIALEDPRQFLENHPAPTIFDEIQRAPELLSYLQQRIDESGKAGQYVLTGSHQLELRQGITQSLAGRTGLLTLFPLSLAELGDAGINFDRFEDASFQGTLPRVHGDGVRPSRVYRDYFRTYVERDVRQLVNLRDAAVFEKFLRLLAGRAGQLVDASSLSNDVGVDQKTISNWISILEASFIVIRLRPYYENFGKRVIKSPKIYFAETGLLCYLLGITEADQVSRDPLRGNIFENLIVTEAFKARANQGEDADLYFWRSSNGQEIDLLHGPPSRLTGVEIKSASTWSRSFLKGFRSFEETSTNIYRRFLVYNGQGMQLPGQTTAYPFDQVASIFRSLD